MVKNIGDETTSMEAPLSPDDWTTYSHGQFGNRSVAFIKQAVAANKPFFAYIGTTGPHLPAQPAPWHAETVRSWVDTVKAPRGACRLVVLLVGTGTYLGTGLRACV